MWRKIKKLEKEREEEEKISCLEEGDYIEVTSHGDPARLYIPKVHDPAHDLGGCWHTGDGKLKADKSIFSEDEILKYFVDGVELTKPDKPFKFKEGISNDNK